MTDPKWGKTVTMDEKDLVRLMMIFDREYLHLRKLGK